MLTEFQIAKLACGTLVGGFGVFYGKEIADKYFELKVLSTMPESYWVTKQKETDAEIKVTEIQEKEETKRHQEELKYKKEKDEKDRAHQLEVMEKEKAYPDSYWLYKTEKVKTESKAKAAVKKQQTDLEKQKTIWNALSTGFDVFARRYTW